MQVKYIIHDPSDAGQAFNIPIAEFDSQYEFGKVFVRGIGIAEGTGDVLAEIDSSGNAHYYLPNHRGDTMLVLSQNGVVESKIRYDAFGNRRSSSYCYENPNETANLPRYLFSTKEYLSDAELYLYAYRVYDPIAGRWTQRDPIDYQDSVNLYQFCGNNPVNGVDADGRFIVVALTIIAIATAVCTGYKIYKTTKNAQAKADKLNKKINNQINNNDINGAYTKSDIDSNQVETGDKLVTETRTLPGIVSTDPMKGFMDGASFANNNIKLKGAKRNAGVTSKQGVQTPKGTISSKTGRPRNEFVRGTTKGGGKPTKPYFRSKKE